MCPLKREQAMRETQQRVMRRLPTADSIVEMGEKVRHELTTGNVLTILNAGLYCSLQLVPQTRTLREIVKVELGL